MSSAIVPGGRPDHHQDPYRQLHPGADRGTYTVTVTNSGVGPTTSTVTVTDTVPLGLTPTAAVGAGWSCTVGAQAVSCQQKRCSGGGSELSADHDHGERRIRRAADASPIPPASREEATAIQPTTPPATRRRSCPART